MNLSDVYEKLAAPFPAAEVRLKPQTVSKDGTKALAISYIDARAVANRLDQIVGPDNWSVSYEVIPGSHVAVKCRLVVLGVAKEDIGEADGKSTQEPYKAATSDAFKRVAASGFAIGRYLYSLPKQWRPWDGRKFTDQRESRPGPVHPLRTRGPVPPAVREEAFEPYA